MSAFGRHGFASAAAAAADARSEITVSDRLPFAVMRKGEDYGWIFPMEHARRVSAANGVEISAVEYLEPEVRMR